MVRKASAMHAIIAQKMHRIHHSRRRISAHENRCGTPCARSQRAQQPSDGIAAAGSHLTRDDLFS